MKRIIKLIQEVNPQWNVGKDIGCSQSIVCKIWDKYKRNVLNCLGEGPICTSCLQIACKYLQTRQAADQPIRDD